MRTITLEEHFAYPGFLEGPGRELKERALRSGGAAAALLEQLCDLGEKRIAEMDAAGIDIQVLSLTSPGTEQLEAANAITMAREANEVLAAAVKRNPRRFAGFATLPTARPDKAAEELEQMVREHSFKGAVINGYHRAPSSWALDSSGRAKATDLGTPRETLPPHTRPRSLECDQCETEA